MTSALSFQDLIASLQAYWRKSGCLDWMPYHETVGAGTYNPATVLRVLGPEPWNVAYVEPSFRPDDGRFAENPNRVQMHHQFQVILQPAPANPLEVYLASLEAIGLNLAEHDIRFVEDNWESPALGAWGLGWEVWLDGMEITQFTYFQQAGGMPLESPAVEITYGLERIATYLQGVKSIWDISWDGKQTYREILERQEIEFCEYEFNVANIDNLRNLYTRYITEANLCLSHNLVIPAHDYVLKCSHTFNLLDARGAIGLAERVKYFGEMRALARRVAENFYAQREKLGFPLLKYTPKWESPVLAPLSSPSTKSEDLLIEIGVEELASSVPEPLVAQLKDGLLKLLAETELTHGSVSAFATPRRLALLIESVQPIQHDKTVTIKGPLKSICEKNSKALEGFCRKNNITPQQVSYQQIDGQEHAAATLEVKGKSALQVLAEKLPEVLAALRAPQSMRWLSASQVGEQQAAVAFNRPIRWITALLGCNIIPFSFASVASNRLTRGGRWENSPLLSLASADQYVPTLKSHHITLDHTERARAIRQQVEQLATAHGYTALINDAILSEVTQLVEFPTAFIGHFNPRFKALPKVILAETMEKHLRFFPALDKDGAISAFIAIRNGGLHSIDTVRHGNERVLEARYSDAEFFFTRDKTKNLEQFRERLKTLHFAENLGSFFDKTERIKELITAVAAALPAYKLPEQALQRAALLSKADLASQMVVEMSALQGKMGRIYAELSNESPQVALAMEEHYLPRYAGDKIPHSPLGIILSLTDKLDTISALFSIGAEPTGSADPYAIRRETLGLISTILGNKLNLPLRPLLAQALRLLKTEDSAAVVERIVDFIKRRQEVILRERGARYDIVRAVLDRIDDNPTYAETLVAELETYLSNPASEGAITAYLRCARIITHAREQGEQVKGIVNPALFATSQEQALWHEISKSDTPHTLPEALKKVASLEAPINDLFTGVTVMDKEKRIRENRLALIWAVAALLDPFANLTLVETNIK